MEPASPAQVGPPVSGADAERAQHLAWHQERLAMATRPSKPAAALAIIGIVAWLVGIALLVLRAGARSARTVRVGGRTFDRARFVAGALTAGGIAAWLLGLYSA
jgi:hypothetical protein